MTSRLQRNWHGICHLSSSHHLSICQLLAINYCYYTHIVKFTDLHDKHICCYHIPNSSENHISHHGHHWSPCATSQSQPTVVISGHVMNVMSQPTTIVNCTRTLPCMVLVYLQNEKPILLTLQCCLLPWRQQHLLPCHQLTCQRISCRSML